MYTVENNLNLVGFTLKKYFNNGHDFENLGVTSDDLYQIGSIGLMKASKRYKEDLGYAFSTFAVKYIKYEIYKELTEKSAIVRFPKDVKAIAMEIVKKDLNYSVKEIMEHYEVTNYKANIILDCITNYYIKSLDEPVNNDEPGKEIKLADLIPGKRDFIPFELKDEFEERMSILSDREREVLILALDRNNQTHVANQLGITQVSVSRHMKSALEKINRRFKPAVGVLN